jgi:hypothetical protein
MRFKAFLDAFEHHGSATDGGSHFGESSCRIVLAILAKLLESANVDATVIFEKTEGYGVNRDLQDGLGHPVTFLGLTLECVDKDVNVLSKVLKRRGICLFC